MWLVEENTNLGVVFSVEHLPGRNTNGEVIRGFFMGLSAIVLNVGCSFTDMKLLTSQ
jgi:hypothetical protein